MDSLGVLGGLGGSYLFLLISWRLGVMAANLRL
jgi:hypothetical protein